MYIFKWHHLTLPLGFTAGGFAFVEYFKQNHARTWDVDIVFYILQYFAVTTWSHMLVAGYLYQRYMTDTDTPQVMPKEPEQIYPSTPLKYGELHQYAQEVRPAIERKDKQFAKVLLAQKALNENSVDLRESTWRAHFGSREAYITLRGRLEQSGAITRKDARLNSPFVVQDWRAIQLLAQGEMPR